MLVRLVIWTLLVHYGSPTFFNIPGNPNTPIYMEETHEDLLRQLAGKRSAVETGDELFNIENAVSAGISFGDAFSQVTVEKDNGDYSLSSGEEKPPIQNLLNKMFQNYDLQLVTTILDGSQILFESGVVSSGGMVTLTGKQDASTFNRELKLTDLEYVFSWQDLLDSSENVLGGRPDSFTMTNLAIRITAKSVVKGERIQVEIEKPINEETKFTFKKYDAIDNVGSINIFAFLGDFYSKIKPKDLATDFDGIDTEKISQINFDRKFTGFGHMSTDGSYQLVLKSDGAIGNVAAFDDAGPDMKIIINRAAGKDVNIAFVGDFGSSDNIKDVVGAVTSNRDESFFKRMRNRDYCLTMSREEFNIIVSDVAFDKYKNSFEKCFPTEFQENTKDLPLKSGVATRIKMSLKGDHSNNDECLAKACDAECTEQYETTTLIGHLTATGITFSYSKSNKIDMLNYLQCIGKDSTLFHDLQLSFINPDNERKFLSIFDFHQELGFLSVTLRATFPETKPGLIFNLAIKTIDFTYEWTDKDIFGKKDKEEEGEGGAGGNAGNTTTSAANTTTSTGGGGGGSDGGADSSKEPSDDSSENGEEENEEESRFKHDVAVTIDGVGSNGEQKNFMCEGEFPFDEFECTMYIASMKLADSLATLIGSKKVKAILEDDSLQNTNILYTGLKNIELKYSSGNNKKISFVSQISLGTYDGISIEVLWYETHGWAFGLSVEKLDVEYIIKLFLEWTGVKVSLPWLRNVEAYVIYSNINLEQLKEQEDGNSASSGSANSEPSRRDILRHYRSKLRSSVPESRSSINKRTEWIQSFIKRVKKRQSNKGQNKKSGKKSKNKKVKGKKSKSKTLKKKKSDNKKKNTKNIEKTKSTKDKKSKGKKKKLKGKAILSRKKKPNPEEMEPADQPSSTGGSSSDDDDDDEEEEEEDESKYQFSLTSLKKESIGAGFRFLFTWYAPDYEEECYDDSICKFIVKNAAGAELSIGGGYFSANMSFYLSAKLTVSIPLNEAKSLTFEEAELQIGLSKDVEKTYIMMSATLQYLTSDLNLKFTGLIKAALSGKLELQFTMKGFVYEPMNIRFFAFGDLYLGAKISIEKGKFSITIEIGATIAIGKISRESGSPVFVGDKLILTGFLGLDPITIVNSWVYAHMNKLTFGMIADAFGQTNFPAKFREDGFHKGLLFSYSNSEQTIEALSKTISSGIHLAGGIKFAFLEATGDFNINYPEGEFEITIDFEPINLLGGLITFTSNTDPKKGPHFYLKAFITEPEKLEININAKFTLFGYGHGVTIILNNGEFDMTVTVSLVFFEISLRLKFVLGNTMPQGAEAWLNLKTTDFLEKLQQWIQEAVLGIQADAKKVDERKNIVEEDAKRAENGASSRMQTWNTAIDNWKDAIEEKERKLQEKAQQSAQAYTTCKDNCNNNKICIPFFVWNSQCWKVWGHWIGCPEWDKCAAEIPDPFCLLGCEVEHLKNSFLEFVQGAINKIEKALTVVADGLNNLVEAFTEAIDLLKKALDGLKKFVLELVADILKAVLDFLDIKIDKLELYAQFGIGFRKCFSYEYDLQVFGTRYQSPSHDETKICLDEILQTIVKKIFGISTDLKKHNEYYDKKDEAEGFVESVEEAEKEVKKTEDKTQNEVDLETSKEVVEGITERRELPDHKFFKHVDDIKSRYYDKYSDEDLDVLETPHHMKPYKKPAHVVKFMEEKAPWKMAQQTIDNPPSHQPQLASNMTAVKRSLILGDSRLSPCDRVKRSLHDYSTLTNGLMQSIKHIETGKVGMNVQRRSDVNKLAEFYAKTHKLGTEYTNYTPRQKRDIYYWYEQLKDGYQEHSRLTKRSFVEHQRDTLPKVKESLDDILGKHVGSSFESYTDELHRHAIDGFKRSNIPKPNDGETLLHGIKRNLTLIVTNEEFPLTHMKRHLNNVNQAIRAVNKQVMQC